MYKINEDTLHIVADDIDFAEEFVIYFNITNYKIHQLPYCNFNKYKDYYTDITVNQELFYEFEDKRHKGLKYVDTEDVAIQAMFKSTKLKVLIVSDSPIESTIFYKEIKPYMHDYCLCYGCANGDNPPIALYEGFIIDNCNKVEIDEMYLNYDCVMLKADDVLTMIQMINDEIMNVVPKNMFTL